MLVEQHRIEERRALRIAEVADGLITGLGGLARRDVRRDIGLREVLQAVRSRPITTAKRITGLIVGSVTQRMRWNGPAPSSSADS